MKVKKELKMLLFCIATPVVKEDEGNRFFAGLSFAGRTSENHRHADALLARNERLNLLKFT